LGIIAQFRRYYNFAVFSQHRIHVEKVGLPWD
jgi:hypothetical protein